MYVEVQRTNKSLGGGGPGGSVPELRSLACLDISLLGVGFRRGKQA
ncbi:hypothetical protein [Alteromonas lipotrueiana]|nr:hypothetical protein [Alteromonas lipotrueiana]